MTDISIQATDTFSFGSFLRDVVAELANPTLAVAAAFACVTVKMFAGFM
ncbi:MAG TPA: hypothetical protein VEB20_24640 [Azospirillaceae bacterium]|nr:hypothetical protein [Azospirillaceae bacterium]